MSQSGQHPTPNANQNNAVNRETRQVCSVQIGLGDVPNGRNNRRFEVGTAARGRARLLTAADPLRPLQKRLHLRLSARKQYYSIFSRQLGEKQKQNKQLRCRGMCAAEAFCWRARLSSSFSCGDACFWRRPSPPFFHLTRRPCAVCSPVCRSGPVQPSITSVD